MGYISKGSIARNKLPSHCSNSRLQLIIQNAKIKLQLIKNFHVSLIAQDV